MVACVFNFDNSIPKVTCIHVILCNENEGSVAGPVIQANGRLSFEDDLRSEGLLYCVSQ